MTFPNARTEIRSHSIGTLLFGFFSLFGLLLILRNAAIAAEYIMAGLLLCARTVIPSLFPFMVLSEMLVSSGFGMGRTSRLLSPLCRLLRLPTAACRAVLLGLLCGFPVGIRCATHAYERGELTRRECETVLACASIPSSAFVIGAVGLSLYGNRILGIVFYVCLLVSSLLCGILISRLRGKDKNASVCAPLQADSKVLPPARLFTDAVRASTANILLICAYVLFFSALMGTLRVSLAMLPLSPTVHAAVNAFLEMSSGVNAAASLSDPKAAALLGAAALGWSGMSVHCQAIALCGAHPLSLRPYFLSKLLQAVLCTLFILLAIHAFPNLLHIARPCSDWAYLI